MVSRDQLAREVLIPLVEALDCSSYVLWRGASVCATSMPGVMRSYQDEWLATDPVTGVLAGREHTWLTPLSRLREWRSIVRHPLYAEWAPSVGVGHLLYARLTASTFQHPEGTAIFLIRNPRQRDFDDRDYLRMARVLPALRQAERRCARLDATERVVPALEAMLEELDPRARLVLDGDGRLLWASAAAAEQLDLAAGELRSALAAAAARAPADLGLRARDGTILPAMLEAVASRHGSRLLLLTVTAGGAPARPREVAAPASLGLTPTERQVLGDMMAGMANADIARRRHVSLATVRTHVAHILEKLGAHSRLQAVVMARKQLGT